MLEQNIGSMMTTWRNRRKRHYRPEFWQRLPAGAHTIYGLDAHGTDMLEEHFKIQQGLLRGEQEGNDEADKT